MYTVWIQIDMMWIQICMIFRIVTTIAKQMGIMCLEITMIVEQMCTICGNMTTGSSEIYSIAPETNVSSAHGDVI